jgi:hypothetical protein
MRMGGQGESTGRRHKWGEKEVGYRVKYKIKIKNRMS